MKTANSKAYRRQPVGKKSVTKTADATGNASTAERDQNIVLPNVTWQAFQAILKALPEGRSVRLAYHQGTLILMSPSKKHEWANRLLERFIVAFCEELNVAVESLGSTLWESELVASGIEPDSCFYIQNERAVRGKEIIDLSVDPPPDLMVEVDITNSSKGKFPICAALGIPELWIYDGDALSIYHLRQDFYAESQTSLVFERISVLQLTNFIELGQSEGMSAAVAAARIWFRQQRDSGAPLD
ncbi:Uma2 family endonuclease [Gloeobacter violaceus]|uniref:Glr2344 protein n=1 Tax=Gloeobacter violaceus (strain ATCC 29082 / PCC 7421) TaxID=251221 RepID=Q7NI40_GLOVI|nr:Uma2 family endonuclease [Gloeobacter violaceus]BAC90285.1 glr2344 [Gloeobacter violaceus PCC 7421]